MVTYYALIISKIRGDQDRRDNQYIGWNADHVALVRGQCLYRRFFITEKGYLGLGPGPMEVGDHVCVLFGGRHHSS